MIGKVVSEAKAVTDADKKRLFGIAANSERYSMRDNNGFSTKEDCRNYMRKCLARGDALLMRPDNAALMLQEMLKNQTAMAKELYKILPDKIEENTRALEQKIEDLIARQREIINENARLKEQIKQSCGGVGE